MTHWNNRFYLSVGCSKGYEETGAYVGLDVAMGDVFAVNVFDCLHDALHDLRNLGGGEGLALFSPFFDDLAEEATFKYFHR